MLRPMENLAARGELLARFLNAPGNSTSHWRVLEVFRFCEELRKLKPNSSLGGNMRRAINGHLSEIQVLPILLPNGDWDWKPGHPGPTLPTEVSPAAALKVIAEFDSNRMLARMRKCQICLQWFFAQTTKKRFCSDACRSEKFRQADPESHKRSRAEYMREYRKVLRVPRAKKKRMRSA
jgi:hypothetical protein